jgi:hypothetical protein
MATPGAAARTAGQAVAVPVSSADVRGQSTPGAELPSGEGVRIPVTEGEVNAPRETDPKDRRR